MLGEIVSMNMKNYKNIKDKTNKGHGNVKKIMDTINERPYGIHQFKAAMLLRKGILLGLLLSNAESMVNLTKAGITETRKTWFNTSRKAVSIKLKCFKSIQISRTWYNSCEVCDH